MNLRNKLKCRIAMYCRLLRAKKNTHEVLSYNECLVQLMPSGDGNMSLKSLINRQFTPE